MNKIRTRNEAVDAAIRLANQFVRKTVADTGDKPSSQQVMEHLDSYRGLLTSWTPTIRPDVASAVAALLEIPV